MKKRCILILVAVLVLSVTACGNKADNAFGADTTAADSQAIENLKATIVTNEGETVTMTADELIEVYDSNEAKFNKLYQYAQIEFIGTVDYLKVDTSVIVKSGTVTEHQQKIVFKEGWCLVIGTGNTAFDLADFNTGDKLKITTSIFGSPFDTEFLQTVSDNRRVVWLVGSDDINHETYSDVKTIIEK